MGSDSALVYVHTWYVCVLKAFSSFHKNVTWYVETDRIFGKGLFSLAQRSRMLRDQ